MIRSAANIRRFTPASRCRYRSADTAFPVSSDRSSCSCRPSHAAGFTLVELIVASTLMALVLSAVYLTFSTTVRAWRAGESNYAPYQDSRRALGLIERELAGIPLNARHLFVGKRDSIEFVTLAPTLNVKSAPGFQLIHVRYRVAEVDDVDSLVREESPVTPPLPAPPAPGDIGLPAQLNTGRRATFVLASDVYAFDLSYEWPAPPLPGLPPGSPPPPVPILSTQRVDYLLPQGVTIRLVVRDEGNLADQQRTVFAQRFTFPTTPSPVPDSLLRARRPRP